METELMDMLSSEESFKPIMEIIEQIMTIPEEDLNEQTAEVMAGMIMGAFTEGVRKEAIEAIIKNFNSENYNVTTASEAVSNAKKLLDEAIDSLQPSKNKRYILNKIFELFYELYDAALEQYRGFEIELPIKLDEGAQLPTYAHETDACADLYASQDITIPAHSLSNMVHTGLHIALPEKWVFMLEPRSSIGFKTGLRLSNAMGIIDEEYRGEIGVLYDNFSDSDFEIKAGDRIAQGWVQPVYRFKPVPVDNLPETERGEGGFGSTGK